MSLARTSAYPLDAVRARERWALDSLQSQLAGAIVARSIARGRHDSMVGEFRSASRESAPTEGSVIEPDASRRRLRHLCVRQAAMTTSSGELALLDAELEQIQQTVVRQRMRVESIERHRARFLRDAAAERERLSRVEADDEWLARLGWQRHACSAAPTSTSGVMLSGVVQGDSR